MDEWNFRVDEMTTLGREGSLPPGYLEALYARQRALNARLAAEIATTASTEGDPALRASLNDPCR
jgi:hypothetical protein